MCYPVIHTATMRLKNLDWFESFDANSQNNQPSIDLNWSLNKRCNTQKKNWNRFDEDELTLSNNKD